MTWRPDEAPTGKAKELLFTQRIVEAVDRMHRVDPERASVFTVKLGLYERWLRRLRISDEALKLFPHRGKLAVVTFFSAVVAVIGAPVALYGWLHRLIPYALIKWSARKFTLPDRRKAQASTTAIAAGIVGFGMCYAVYIAVFQWLFGWPASLWYALSLPVTGMLAHYYLREITKLSASLRATTVLLWSPFAAKQLLATREELIAEIEAVRREIVKSEIRESR